MSILADRYVQIISEAIVARLELVLLRFANQGFQCLDTRLARLKIEHCLHRQQLYVGPMLIR